MTARRAALAIAVVGGWIGFFAAGQASADAGDGFRRGLARYEAGDYAAAATEFEQAYADEPSVTILFAWAQAVRQGGDCRKAIELYERLLAGKLRRKQRAAVKKARTACRRAVARAARAAPPEPPAAQPAPPAETSPAPPPPEPAATAPAPAAPVPRAPAPASVTTAPPPARRWYADPLGGVLLGSAVAGIGVGVGLWASASSIDRDADDAGNYFDYAEQKDRASRRRTYAAVSAGAGSALLVAAVLRYALAGGDAQDSRTAAPWVGRDGEVGLTVGGAF